MYLALFALALALTMAFAATAFAADVSVWGAQTQITQAALASDDEYLDVDLVDFAGTAGDTVFLTVREGDELVAELLPHEIGQVDNADGSSVDTGSSADVFQASLPKEGLEDKLRAGVYQVAVFPKHVASNPQYEGTLYGVWAHLAESDGAESGEMLIGTRMVATSGSPEFTAPEILYKDGQAYRLVGDAQGEGALVYPYEAYDESKTIDGVIKYVDESGAVISSTPIPGIIYGEQKTIDIPTAVTSGDAVYRTLSKIPSVTAVNPGQTTFVVRCAKISDEDALAAGHYVATIRLVDEDGNLIAQDSVNVTGDFVYTAPGSIYKSHAAEQGKDQMLTYEGVNEADMVQHLSAANDRELVKDGARTIEIVYKRAEAEPLSVDVAINLIDGQQRVGRAESKLGSKTVTVDAANPKATPEQTITVDGTEYRLAGSPDSYTYEYGSGKTPVIDAYYVPANYEVPGPYTVTLNYVDFATGKVISSETATSSPDSLGDLELAPPAEFTEGGITYVRLPGQEEPIYHSYFSNITTYTVYYRDRSDTLTSAVVIDRVRVVYRDVPGGATAVEGEASGEGENVTSAALNQAGTYNVVAGEGNGTLTNEAGVDSNQERIDDDAVALSSGIENQGAEATTVFGVPIWSAVIAGALIAVAIAAGLALARKRHHDGQQARL